MAYAPEKNYYEGPPPPSYQPPLGQGYASPPPPGQGYAQPPPIPTYTISPPPPIQAVIVQPGSVFLGHNPQPMQCPSCGQSILTQVTYDAGGITWLMVLLICVFGGVFGCCLIPFCVAGCQDATHTCPACRAFIGRRSPF